MRDEEQWRRINHFWSFRYISHTNTPTQSKRGNFVLTLPRKILKFCTWIETGKPGKGVCVQCVCIREINVGLSWFFFVKSLIFMYFILLLFILCRSRHTHIYRQLIQKYLFSLLFMASLSGFVNKVLKIGHIGCLLLPQATLSKARKAPNEKRRKTHSVQRPEK